MIHPERRRENLKKIEEMNKHDAGSLQPDWKTWCMNKKVDMVEVVRCKDCKHRSKQMYDYYGNPENKVYVCQINEIAKKPDWFCADGEQR